MSICFICILFMCGIVYVSKCVFVSCTVHVSKCRIVWQKVGYVCQRCFAEVCATLKLHPSLTHALFVHPTRLQFTVRHSYPLLSLDICLHLTMLLALRGSFGGEVSKKFMFLFPS